MKTYLSFLLLLFSSLSFAQSVIIDPSSSSSSIFTGNATDKGMLVPRMTEAYRNAIISPEIGLLVYQTDNAVGFYVYNGTWTAVTAVSELEKVTESGNTGHRIFGRNPANHGNIGANAIDLSTNNGLSSTKGATGQYSTAIGLGTTASSYVSIAFGENTTASGKYSTAMGLGTTASMDFSTAMGSNTTASGVGSTATGIGTTAKSYGEFTIGSFNTDYTPTNPFGYATADRAFAVGIGTNTTAKDGLIVYKDGTLALDRLTSVPVTPASRLYVLNNKLHYNNAEVGSNLSELEKITENGKTGYRLLGRNAANYGDIGNDALDLSISPIPSTTRGATGTNSVAIGNFATASGTNSVAIGYNATARGGSISIGQGTTAGNNDATQFFAATAMGDGTTASATYSTALGYRTTASQAAATAMGDFTTASGRASTSMGLGTTAKSTGEAVVGTLNTDYAPIDDYGFNVADRAFVVGIGNFTSGAVKKDGLITFKSGNTFISNSGGTPSDGNASILGTGVNVAALQVKSSGSGINIETATASNSINIQKLSAPAAGSKYIAFGYKNVAAFTEIGSISATSTSAIAYNTTSDRRLKIDNGIYLKGLATINGIKIHDYTWKETRGKDIGVFAQELKEVYPNAVMQGDDETQEDPTQIKERWQVDYSKLVPVLVSAVQELSKENAALKAKVNELDSLKAEISAITEILLLRNSTNNTSTSSAKN